MSENNGSRSKGKGGLNIWRPGGRANRRDRRNGLFEKVRPAALMPAVQIICGLAMIAAMSVGLILTHDFLTQCDYFKADVLSVEGCRQLERETVLQQARVAPGVNLLSVNLTLARKRLLAHPWIADAQVSRELPSGLHIRIQEHAPLAILDMGRRFIINLDGAVFKEYDPSDRLDVPVVQGLEFMDIPLPERTGSAPFRAVMTVLGMGRQSSGTLPNRVVRSIRVDREMGLTLHLPDHAPGPFTTVQLGYDDRANGRGYAVKYERFQEIIDFLEREGSFLRVDAIDLKDLDRIVINPAAGNIESLSEDQKEV